VLTALKNVEDTDSGFAGRGAEKNDSSRMKGNAPRWIGSVPCGATPRLALIPGEWTGFDDEGGCCAWRSARSWASLRKLASKTLGSGEIEGEVASGSGAGWIPESSERTGYIYDDVDWDGGGPGGVDGGWSAMAGVAVDRGDGKISGDRGVLTGPDCRMLTLVKSRS
jgi:hypothetical protein